MTVGAIEGFRTEEIAEDEMVKARAAYFAAVDFLDEILGDFLALLDRDGFLDNTVIVYTSDHGELAGEHGIWWKNTWHEAATHVPLIVSLPEHRNGNLDAREIRTPRQPCGSVPHALRHGGNGSSGWIGWRGFDGCAERGDRGPRARRPRRGNYRVAKPRAGVRAQSFG